MNTKRTYHFRFLFLLITFILFSLSLIWYDEIYTAVFAWTEEKPVETDKFAGLSFDDEPIKDAEPGLMYIKEQRYEEEAAEREALRLEEERLAEEKRLEEERIAEEKRLEEERLAEQKRLEEEREAEVLHKAKAKAKALKEKEAQEKAAQEKAEAITKTTTATEETKTEAPAAPPLGTYLGEFEATAYAIGDGLTPSTVTANGTNVANTIYSPEGYRIIAVDTAVIPMNTIVRVEIPGWEPFLAKASDTGSAINGKKIDLLVDSINGALNFGRQYGIKIYRMH